MASLFDKLCNEQLVTKYPAFLKANIHYECIMGSVAYGVSDDTSDMDVYGFAIPPRNVLFPYSHGYILGFDKKPIVFNQFQKHHIKDVHKRKEYDITIYNIVKFFRLCMENNPNIVDALFVPERCILHSTAVGNHVRDNRKIFLSKKVYHTFKGYAFSQLHKMRDKYAKDFVEHCTTYNIDIEAPLKDILAPIGQDQEAVSRMLYIVAKIESNGKRSKRLKLIAKHGYDTKFLYHLVRLVDECQQILEEKDLDLTRSREHLKAIRRGEWPVDKGIDYFEQKLILLEDLYKTSTLPIQPDEDLIKALLLECIEMHYGSLQEYSDASRLQQYVIEAQELLTKISNGL